MSLSRDQISVFTRRVAALSSGQVAVPSVQINRSEAVALWRDLRVVFGSIGGSSPLLTLREFAALRVRAAARSFGSMRLEVRDLTVAQGLAAWRAVKLLGKIAGRDLRALDIDRRSGLVSDSECASDDACWDI